MRFMLIRFLTVGSVVLSAPLALGAGRNPALSTAELMLALARDHGLRCRGSQTAADVLHIRTLLRASTRLDARLAEGHMWLHELALLRGDAEEAALALRNLMAAHPEHRGALDRWLEIGPRECQTLEQRDAWLRQTLASGPPQPEFHAMVHVHLARLALAQLDHETARQEIRKALALDPWNPEAAQLQLELLDEGAPSTERLRAALQLLELNPFHVDAAFGVAVLLDEYGLLDEAATFYKHALTIHSLANPDEAIPGMYMLQLARHALARGRLNQAEEYAVQAAKTDPAVAAEAGMFLHWLLVRQRRSAELMRVHSELVQRFARCREPGEWPVNEVAQAAWFYCLIDSQPQRALMLAESAASRAPDDAFTRRVLGWAQAANLQNEQAELTLMPIAGEDPFAAYRLAKLYQEAGNAEAAERVVRDLRRKPTAGRAYELLAELELDTADFQSYDTTHPEISAVLSRFNRSVLEFYQEPARFVEASVRVDDRTPNPGEPWWAEFSLTNRADFPITLGPAWMLNPVLLVSYELQGDRSRSYPYLLTITIEHARVLAPGATVRVRRLLDLGGPRQASRFSPQQAQRVTIHALLDPVLGVDGRWHPGLAGQKLAPVHFNRLPAAAGPEALRGLLRMLSAPSNRERFRALEQMAQLLGEQQRSRLGRLNYRPEPIPTERIMQALLAALRSESWQLRARTLDALQIVGLDARLLDAATACLADSHWLVRLMAVRLLGERQGPAAAETLRELSDGDADELVRELARAYLLAWGLLDQEPDAGRSTPPADAYDNATSWE